MQPSVPADPGADLRLIHDLVARAEQRVDPHAFHFVHWGAIVLVWYPAANLLERAGRLDLCAAVGGGALLLGILLSVLREKRLGKRLAGEDLRLGDQVMWITIASIGAGLVLSVAAPVLHFLEGRHMPIVWGLVYANLTAMTGIVYRREFAWSGLVIFAASLVAMAWPEWSGVILGPVMGLGLMIPGWMAERRVRALARG
jgi:hypothetical protein